MPTKCESAEAIAQFAREAEAKRLGISFGVNATQHTLKAYIFTACTSTYYDLEAYWEVCLGNEKYIGQGSKEAFYKSCIDLREQYNRGVRYNVYSAIDINQFDKLEDRLKKIAILVALGCNNQSISESLGWSVKTVKNKLTWIYLVLDFKQFENISPRALLASFIWAYYPGACFKARDNLPRLFLEGALKSLSKEDSKNGSK